jgi:membrane-associated protease RseP (regulator of RpoE activity)
MRRTFSAAILAMLLAGVPALAETGATAAPPRRERERRVVWIGGPRAFLGVTTLDVTPDLRAFYGAPKDSGVLVASVEPGSPAASAGIRVGDVITRVDGRSVDSPWGLADELGDHKKGDRVSIEVVRDRSTRKIDATLAERDESEGDLAERMAVDMRKIPMLRVQKMEKVFRTPEWKARLDGLDECDRVRKRLEAVEERLKVIEQSLPRK